MIHDHASQFTRVINMQALFISSAFTAANNFDNSPPSEISPAGDVHGPPLRAGFFYAKTIGPHLSEQACKSIYACIKPIVTAVD